MNQNILYVGYCLQRDLHSHGWHCDVVAPSRFSTTDISVIVDLPDVRPAACCCGNLRFQE